MQGYREMAGVSKIDDFLRSSDFLTGHPDYEYGSNVKKKWLDVVGKQFYEENMVKPLPLATFYAVSAQICVVLSTTSSFVMLNFAY